MNRAIPHPRLGLRGALVGLVGAISVIKAGRVVRIFRLAMRVKGIRQLLETLIYTLPSLFNVCCLLLIVVFIFTVLGMAFFGNQVALPAFLCTPMASR